MNTPDSVYNLFFPFWSENNELKVCSLEDTGIRLHHGKRRTYVLELDLIEGVKLWMFQPLLLRFWPLTLWKSGIKSLECPIWSSRPLIQTPQLLFITFDKTGCYIGPKKSGVFLTFFLSLQVTGEDRGGQRQRQKSEKLKQTAGEAEWNEEQKSVWDGSFLGRAPPKHCTFPQD